jgi:hypothetical protein
MRNKSCILKSEGEALEDLGETKRGRKEGKRGRKEGKRERQGCRTHGWQKRGRVRIKTPAIGAWL